MRPSSQKFYRKFCDKFQFLYLLQTCSTREVLLQYSGENAGIPKKPALASAASAESAESAAAPSEESEQAALPAAPLRPQAPERARGQKVQESQLLRSQISEASLLSEVSIKIQQITREN